MFFSRTRMAILCVTLFSTSVFSVEITPKKQNSVYAELLGPGFLYSINYDRLILNNFSIRAGINYIQADNISLGWGDYDIKVISIPVLFNYLGLHHGSHHLETGIGPVMFNAFVDNEYAARFMMDAIIGYRFQPQKGGFQFRTGFNLLYGDGLNLFANNNDNHGFNPWGYLSFGYAF